MLLLNLLIKPIWIFLIDRNVQLTAGYEEYGLYAALLNLSIIFNIMLDLGITAFNNKSIAEKPERIKEYLPNMLVAKSLLSLLYLGVIALVAISFSYSGRSLQLLFLLGLAQFANSFLLFLRSYISGNHHFKTDAVLSVLDKILMIAICSIILFVPAYNQDFVIEWFVYAQLAAYAVSIVIALTLILARYTRLNFSLLSLASIKKLLGQSLPFALLILLMGLYMRIDSVLLERLMGEEGAYENGVYISAFRILDALNMIGFLFAGILLPMFSRMFARKQRVDELLQMSTNILLPISLIVLAFSLWYGGDIMYLLYNKKEGYWVFKYVMMSFPAYCLMYLYSTLLTAKGKIFLLIKIAFVSSALSIVLNLIFIPQLGAEGVAKVSILVHWFAAFAYIFFSIREQNLAIKWSRCGQFFILFLSFFGLNYLFNHFDLNIWLSIALNAVLFVPFLYLLQLWNWTVLVKYFKEFSVRE